MTTSTRRPHPASAHRPPAGPAPADGAPDGAPADRAAARRAAAARRRRRRLRRTVLVAVLLLVVGTVLVRKSAHPGTTPGTAAPAPGRTLAAAPAASPTTTATTPAASSAASASSAATTSSAPSDDDGAPASSPAAGATPAPVPSSGDGVVTPVDIPAGPVAASGRTVRYSVELEGGLPVAGADVARTVMTVLTDPRGWQTRDHVRFVAVGPAELARGAAVDIRVTLASPTLTARLCAPLDVTRQQVSCWNGSRSVLNLTRWVLGSSTYGADLADYRIYLVSHEVGHGLGHDHVHCPSPGRPAPVMVQQTKTLEGCTAQPWATGA